MSTLEKCARALQDSDLVYSLPDDGTVEGNDWRERECKKAAQELITTLAANLDEKAVEAALDAYLAYNNAYAIDDMRAAIAAYLNTVAGVE